MRHCHVVERQLRRFAGEVPIKPLSPSLDAIGLVARNARDIVVAAPVLAPVLEELDEIRRTTTIAVLSDCLAGSHAAVRSCCEDAVQAFENLGFTLHEKAGLEIIEDGGGASKDGQAA